MIPTRAVRLQLGELLAAQASTLAPAADNNVIALVKNDFAESENLALGDLELADFDGSTPLLQGLGTQPVGIDPNTDDQVIALEDPAGGWRWEVSGLTNLPQTIYGFVLLNEAMDTLLASENFPEPLTLSAVGHQIIIGVAKMTIVQAPIS